MRLKYNCKEENEVDQRKVEVRKAAEVRAEVRVEAEVEAKVRVEAEVEANN